MRSSVATLFVALLLLCAQFSFSAVTKKKFSMDGSTASAETVESIASSERVKSKAPSDSVVQDNQSVVSIHDSHIFCLTENFADQQKKLRENIAAKITAMKNGESGIIWTFLLICFLYGMLHALGPGHGKSIVVGYFLARKGKWKHGIALGAGITFTHTLSAVILLFVLYGILKAAVFPSFELGRQGIEKVSYGLVCFTGLLLIGIAVHDLVKLLRSRHIGENKAGEVAVSKNTSWKELIGVAAVTGIVPCPAVALIVLFCLLNSMVALALASAGAVCVGMTVTNMLFGIAAVALKKGIDKGAAKTGWLAAYIHIVASFAGGLVVFLAGLFMLC
ncbi:MAG: hypothetical protein MJY87_04395 [Fibrobacter sp.]|nr:hypothetical protein [Fibrobacter sp.]